MLILGSVALAGVKLVVLKMLPFDNKSEFQVVVDMPAGTPVENTAAVLHEMGAHLATVPEVTDYQAYAGTSRADQFQRPGAPVLPARRLRARRPAGEPGRQAPARPQEPRHRARGARPHIEAIGRRFNARVKVVEVPPGPPVLAPIVAEVYGPDEAGRIRVAKQVREAFAATPDIVGIDDSVEDAAPRIQLRVDQAKAALLGVSRRDVVETMRMGLSGADVTPLHDGVSKYEVPVRLTLPAERRGELAEFLKLTLRAADGALVPLSELVKPVENEREQPIYHKDLLPVVYVVGDMAGKLDSPLYGMFAARGKLAGQPLEEGGAGRILHPPALRPLPPVRGQVGRRMAGHLRDLPRHGARLRGRPGPDLPAGGGAVPLLPHAAGHHGADPAHRHRRDARARAARRASSPPPR